MGSNQRIRDPTSAQAIATTSSPGTPSRPSSDCSPAVSAVGASVTGGVAEPDGFFGGFTTTGGTDAAAGTTGVGSGAAVVGLGLSGFLVGFDVGFGVAGALKSQTWSAAGGVMSRAGTSPPCLRTAAAAVST